MFSPNFLFSLVLVLFPFLHHYFSPRPDIKDINLTKEAQSYVIDKISSNSKINFLQKKRIGISDTYVIKDHLMGSIYLTNFSAWSYKTLDFSVLSSHFPDLVIENPVINRINTSSYANGKINNNNFSQACLFDSTNFYFDKPKYKRLNYSNIVEWYKIFKRSLNKNIFLTPRKTYSCLLITIANSEFFEEEFKLIFDLVIVD